MTRMIVVVLGPASAATRIISGSTGSDSVRSTITPMTRVQPPEVRADHRDQRADHDRDERGAAPTTSS